MTRRSPASPQLPSRCLNLSDSVSRGVSAPASKSFSACHSRTAVLFRAWQIAFLPGAWLCQDRFRYSFGAAVACLWHDYGQAMSFFDLFSRKVTGFWRGPSLFQGLFKDGLCVFDGTFQDFDLFQGRSVDLQQDLPYFEGFSRMVSALLAGPSRILALFKDGRQICSCLA